MNTTNNDALREALKKLEIWHAATGKLWPTGDDRERFHAEASRTIRSALAASKPEPKAVTDDAIQVIADEFGNRYSAPDEEGMCFEKHALFDFARAIKATASQPKPTEINGLTKEETDATASVMGLTQKPEPVSGERAELIADLQEYACNSGYRHTDYRDTMLQAAAMLAADGKPKWKDDDTAKLVNDLRDIAIQFHDTQQLRERIAHIIRPLAHLRAADSEQIAMLEATLESRDRNIETLSAENRRLLAADDKASGEAVDWKAECQRVQKLFEHETLRASHLSEQLRQVSEHRDHCLRVVDKLRADDKTGLAVAWQGGLSNDELLAQWKIKLPKVAPTDEQLSAFALGVEVGASLNQVKPGHYVIRHNNDGEFGQAVGWLYRDGGEPCIVTGKPVYVWRPLTDLTRPQPQVDCAHIQCPQLHDGEPGKSGRSCPLDGIGKDHS